MCSERTQVAPVFDITHVHLFIYLFVLLIFHSNANTHYIHACCNINKCHVFPTQCGCVCVHLYTYHCLTLILLTWRIGWASNNANRWKMGLNWAFKGLIWLPQSTSVIIRSSINCLIFIMDMNYVVHEVGTEFLYII
jgi:hypothetical protein